MDKMIDVEANRKARKYSTGILFARVLWGVGRMFFRCSPRIAYRYRALLLRMFGAKVGKNVNIYHTAVIYFPWNLSIAENSSIGDNAMIYNLGMITIGARTTISQRAHLCAGSHDFSDPAMPLLKPPITIGSDVWVCADAFVGPNIKIGNGSVVGARSVVVKEVPAWKVVAGNPAKIVKDRILI